MAGVTRVDIDSRIAGFLSEQGIETVFHQVCDSANLIRQRGVSK